jgi:hypothetical protein
LKSVVAVDASLASERQVEGPGPGRRQTAAGGSDSDGAGPGSDRQQTKRSSVGKRFPAQHKPAPFPSGVTLHLNDLLATSAADSVFVQAVKNESSLSLFEPRPRITINLDGDDAATRLQLALLRAAMNQTRKVALTLGDSCIKNAAEVATLLGTLRILDTLSIDVLPRPQCIPVLSRLLLSLHSNRRLLELRVSRLFMADESACSESMPSLGASASKSVSEYGDAAGAQASADAFYAALVALLRHQPRLQHLTLSAAGGKSSLNLTHSIPPLQHLIELSLNGFTLAPLALQLLRPALHWRMRELNLSGSPLEASAVPIIMQQLADMQRLHTLDLSWSALKDAGATLLATDALPRLYALRELTLQGAGLTPASIDALIAAAVSLPALRTLDVRSNDDIPSATLTAAVERHKPGRLLTVLS